MKVQKSFQAQRKVGSLTLVPTPIGNLQDMTFRAVDILRQADYIAAEDTRQTQKLLNHFDIHNKLVSYHEHNKRQSGQRILEDLRAGKHVALVSDAGMPGISDPGTDLVQAAITQDIPVISLPGPNAALTALVASGQSTDHFLFYGFLDRNKKKKKVQLDSLRRVPYAMIFYESPHRIKETLSAILHTLGNRQISLVREISKRHEEYVRGSVEDVFQWATEHTVRGEFCLIVSGHEDIATFALDAGEEKAWWEEMSVQEHVDTYINEGQTSKEAIKKVAKDRQVSKRDVYQTYHVRGDIGNKA
ncbi:16S rRNA (cytidine(1402)-2'-O)-methyltransferase [Caldalkalibacillus salinus]|uniref:16S rRNA (cytidine(1402)-2'-O)-methyltransferase n=1 Tax=Caldalkalibacillus salinus TaxID=2803787 RepID=UPI001921516B|nr:16S rRNA (cytidine(1402)-2'-O)-methyltransferase [Caldalkalibacillus salinus]